MIATVIRSGKTCIALWTSTKINKNYLFGENQPTLLHRNPPFFTDFPCSTENYWVESKQKHKKQPLADASASHLSLVMWHVWFQANHINRKPKGRFFWFVVWGWGLNQPHHITNAALASEVGGIAKRIKAARLRRKTKPGRDVILHVRP